MDEKKLKARLTKVLKEFNLEPSEVFISVQGEIENPYITILFETLPIEVK